MVKRLFFVALIAGMVLSFSACGKENRPLSEEELAENQAFAASINAGSSFELGFLEDVKNRDLTAFGYEAGFGCAEYYNEEKYGSYNGAKKRGIIYEATAYPDYIDGGWFITQIDVTDPDATFLGGVSLNSGEEAIEAALKGVGFQVGRDTYPSGKDFIWAKKGMFGVVYEQYAADICFFYSVTNREGLIY